MFIFQGVIIVRSAGRLMKTPSTPAILRIQGFQIAPELQGQSTSSPTPAISLSPFLDEINWTMLHT